MENLKSLILKDISKSFGEKSVLLGINLSFARGKVYALLGENGSGKSTLAKIISGEIKADKGRFFGVYEKSENSENQIELNINSPKDAIKHKIGIVSQNPTVCKDLPVWENIFLGDGKTLSPFFVEKSKVVEKVKNQLLEMGISLDLQKKGKDCRASEKFFVCLARTLFLEKDILILDEPTASLSKEEKEVLFKIIRDFKNAGKIVILITHHKEEAISLSDEIVFLQKEKSPIIGEDARKRVELFSFDEAGSETAASRGSSVSLGESSVPADSENTAFQESSCFLDESVSQVDSKDGLVFAVENLFAYESPLSKIEDLSFSVKKGEITCVKGQWETGLSLLEDVVSGMKGFSKGKIYFAGKTFSKDSKPKFDTRLLRKKGTSIIPSDKINRGSPNSLEVKDLFLGENSIKVKSVSDFIKKAKIDAKPSTKVKSLSGGMLQRLILQRELSFGGDFMIFSNPTSGLDFAGIEELVFTLEKLKKEGKAILVLSVDDVQIEKISNLCISI